MELYGGRRFGGCFEDGCEVMVCVCDVKGRRRRVRELKERKTS